MWSNAKLDELSCRDWRGRSSSEEAGTEQTEQRQARQAGATGSRTRSSNLDRLESSPTCVTQDLLDRIARLETQTQFETSEDDARIKQLEQALRDYGIPLGGRVAKVARMAQMYGSPTGRISSPSPITQQDELNQRYFMSGYAAGEKDASGVIHARTC